MTLECRAEGDPTPAVSWESPAARRAQPGAPGPAGPTDFRQTGVAVMQIGAATRQDSGVYTCRASNSAGQTEQRLQLMVESDPTPVRPDQTTPRPRPDQTTTRPIRPSEDVYRVPLNGRAELTCYVVGACLAGVGSYGGLGGRSGAVRRARGPGIVTLSRWNAGATVTYPYSRLLRRYCQAATAPLGRVVCCICRTPFRFVLFLRYY